MDDLDIYDDLDEFHEQEQRKSKELLELETKYNEALQTIEAMKLEKKDLRKKIRIMEQNLQSLLDTAKAEIKRKDKLIEELRNEKDDICFRRQRVQPTPRLAQVTVTEKNVPSISQQTITVAKASVENIEDNSEDVRKCETLESRSIASREDKVIKTNDESKTKLKEGQRHTTSHHRRKDEYNNKEKDEQRRRETEKLLDERNSYHKSRRKSHSPNKNYKEKTAKTDIRKHEEDIRRSSRSSRYDSKDHRRSYEKHEKKYEARDRYKKSNSVRERRERDDSTSSSSSRNRKRHRSPERRYNEKHIKIVKETISKNLPASPVKAKTNQLELENIESSDDDFKLKKSNENNVQNMELIEKNDDAELKENDKSEKAERERDGTEEKTDLSSKKIFENCQKTEISCRDEHKTVEQCEPKVDISKSTVEIQSSKAKCDNKEVEVERSDTAYLLDNEENVINNKSSMNSMPVSFKYEEEILHKETENLAEDKKKSDINDLDDNNETKQNYEDVGNKEIGLTAENNFDDESKTVLSNLNPNTVEEVAKNRGENVLENIMKTVEVINEGIENDAVAVSHKETEIPNNGSDCDKDESETIAHKLNITPSNIENKVTTNLQKAEAFKNTLEGNSTDIDLDVSESKPCDKSDKNNLLIKEKEEVEELKSDHENDKYAIPSLETSKDLFDESNEDINISNVARLDEEDALNVSDTKTEVINIKPRLVERVEGKSSTASNLEKSIEDIKDVEEAENINTQSKNTQETKASTEEKDNEKDNSFFSLTISSDEEDTDNEVFENPNLQTDEAIQQKEKIEIIENIRLPMLYQLTPRSKNSPRKQKFKKKDLKVKSKENKIKNESIPIVNISEESDSEKNNIEKSKNVEIHEIIDDSTMCSFPTTTTTQTINKINAITSENSSSFHSIAAIDYNQDNSKPQKNEYEKHKTEKCDEIFILSDNSNSFHSISSTEISETEGNLKKSHQRQESPFKVVNCTSAHSKVPIEDLNHIKDHSVNCADSEKSSKYYLIGTAENDAKNVANGNKTNEQRKLSSDDNKTSEDCTTVEIQVDSLKDNNDTKKSPFLVSKVKRSPLKPRKSQTPNKVQQSQTKKTKRPFSHTKTQNLEVSHHKSLEEPKAKQPKLANTSADVRAMLIDGKSPQISNDVILSNSLNGVIDLNLDEIEKDMQAIFQSPMKVENNSPPSPIDCDPNANSTKLEANINQSMIESTNVSTASDTSVDAKCLSLGSSQYVVERVSENVVNLFITRRRSKKRVKSTASLDGSSLLK